MYRLAMLLVMLAVGAVGCGGGGDDSKSSSPSAVAKTPTEAAKKEAASDDKAKKDSQKAKEEKSDEEKEDQPLTHEEIEEARADEFKKLPPKKKNPLIETVARSALLRFGLKLDHVEVRQDGRVLRVFVTRKSACNAIAREEANIALAITEGAPGVKRVSLWVGREALGYYVLRCPKQEMPDGPGRTVFEHTGVGGAYTSKKIKIDTKRWALEYENQATSLAILVKAVGGESKGEYFRPVGSQKREVGRNNYKGKGVFQLVIYGAGGWSVRVKEVG